MFNIRNLIAVATVGTTLLGFAGIASAHPDRWRGPIYQPIHIVYNPVRYAPVPVPPCGFVTGVYVAPDIAFARRERPVRFERFEARRRGR